MMENFCREIEKSNLASSKIAAEASVLLPLLLYAALACTISTLRREHRVGEVGGWKYVIPPAENQSHKTAAGTGAHVPVRCP